MLDELICEVSDEEIVGLANNGLNAVHISVKKGHLDAFHVLSSRLNINDLATKTGMNEDLQCVARQSGNIQIKDAVMDLGIFKL